MDRGERGRFLFTADNYDRPTARRQLAARQADPRTTTIYDRRRQNFDRHAAYVASPSSPAADSNRDLTAL